MDGRRSGVTCDGATPGDRLPSDLCVPLLSHGLGFLEDSSEGIRSLGLGLGANAINFQSCPRPWSCLEERRAALLGAVPAGGWEARRLCLAAGLCLSSLGGAGGRSARVEGGQKSAAAGGSAWQAALRCCLAAEGAASAWRTRGGLAAGGVGPDGGCVTRKEGGA